MVAVLWLRGLVCRERGDFMTIEHHAPGARDVFIPRLRSSVLRQWLRQRRCKRNGGHCWHTLSAWDNWRCCRCAGATDEQPQEECTRCIERRIADSFGEMGNFTQLAQFTQHRIRVEKFHASIIWAAGQWVDRIGDHPNAWADDEDFALIQAVEDERAARGEPRKWTGTTT